MKHKIIFLLLFCLCIAQQAVHGQIRQYYHKDPNGLLEEQAKQLFRQVYQVLDSHPPDSIHTSERKLGLMALDGILHDTRLDTSLSLKNHFSQVVARVVDSLETIAVDEGVRVYKIYNHGFILQSQSVTVAIDLVRGSRHAHIADSAMQKLVDLSDILLITHRHGDHADAVVADMFVKQNKKVIVPPNLWGNKSNHYVHLRDSVKAVKKNIRLDGQHLLSVQVFPGHQGKELNNMYAITTPEGTTVMHTGDQANAEDLAWIKRIKYETTVDVLLLHCWMSNLEEVLSGISPKLIVTGHENELGHSIDHREPYWLTLEKMKSISFPYVIMAWGENYWYRPSF